MVAPADWEEVRLGEHSSFFKGNGLSKAQLIDDGPHSCVHYGELFTHYGSVIETVTSNCVEFDGSFKSLAGDVLMPGSDVTPKGLATASAIKVSDVVLGGDIIVIRSNPVSFHGPFLSNFIRINRGRVLRLVKGSTVYHIHAKDLADLKVLKPTLREQEAIAQALSDADKAIESLDVLIAKKRDLKQAVMQQLLTGRTRLPGFTGDWQEERLGEIAHVVMGQSPPSTHYNTRGQGLPLIQGNADIVSRKSIRRIWTSVTPKVAESGDVLITVRAPVGYAAIASERVCLGRGVCAVQPRNANASFIFHSLVHREPNWKKLEQGSTFTAANSKEVKDFTIYSPKSLKEQEAIAEVLSVMDEELEALTDQVSKLRMVKEGMMQDLLTGKVRLV